MKANFSFLVLGVLIFFMITGTLVAQDKSGLQVVEAKLGKDVQDRMISEETTKFPIGSKVFLWMKLSGTTSDQQINVNWKTGNSSFTPQQLTFGGNPWRTWVWKTASRSGDWTVTVTDAKGNVLKELSFKVE